MSSSLRSARVSGFTANGDLDRSESKLPHLIAADGKSPCIPGRCATLQAFPMETPQDHALARMARSWGPAHDWSEWGQRTAWHGAPTEKNCGFER